MTNKEFRTKWIGFDDKFFMLVGIPLLAVVASALNHSPENSSLDYLLLNYLISLSFSILNWIGFRWIAIKCRQQYPLIKDDQKRIMIMAMISFVYFFIANVGWAAVLDWNFGPLIEKFNKVSSPQSIAAPFVLSVMMIAIYEVIYFNTRLHISEKLREQTKIANTISQLNALKNQSKPHFLFNSLNTLQYVISNESKEKARHFVDELATVYRYIIGIGNENLITLGEELKFVESYLFVQNERFGDNLKVHLMIPPKNLKQMVVPLSVQQLIENAIKHNVISSKKPLHVEVYIDHKEAADYLVVSNKKILKSSPLYSTKTGLQNLESSYLLLTNLPISVSDTPQEFKVEIPLLHSSKLESLQYANSNS